MADRKLVDYIKEAVKKGYSIPKIKEILIANGQNARTVEEAVKAVAKTNSKKIFRGILIVAGIIAVVIILIFAIVFIVKFLTPYATPELIANLSSGLRLNCSKQTVVKSCFAYALGDENECVQENKEYEERCRVFYNIFKAVTGEGECAKVNNADQKLLCECITQDDKSKCLAANFGNMNLFEKEKLENFGSEEKGIFYDSVIGKDTEKCKDIANQLGEEVCRVLSGYVLAAKNSDVGKCDNVGALEGREQTSFCKAIVLKDATLCPENDKAQKSKREGCVKQEIWNIKNHFKSQDVCSMFPDEDSIKICNSL